MDPILRRIARALAGPPASASDAAPTVLDRLAALPGADLQSLLLAVVRSRAAQVTPTALNAAARRGGVVAPSAVDARLFHAIDGAAFAAAADFEAVELSPVAPLGLDTQLGAISPNNVLATIRGQQLLADPTTALALEAVRRRRGVRVPAGIGDTGRRRGVRVPAGIGDTGRRQPQGPRAAPVRLCSAARVFRMQPLPPGEPLFTPHFRLFAMVTAGRDEGSFAFELRSLREQLAAHLRLAAALPALGVDVRAVEIAISDTDAIHALLRAGGIDADGLAGLVHGYDADGGAATLAARGIDLPRTLDPDRDLGGLDDEGARTAHRRLSAVLREVVPPLVRDFPSARVRLDGARLAGLGYYRGLTLQIWLTTADGVSFPVGDGGFTTWTQTLQGDRKERLLTSGLGVELLAKRFTRAAAPPPKT